MDSFDDIIKAAWEVLKPLGYKKKARTFYVMKSGNLGLINLQKRSMGLGQYYFTINIGVSSAKLREFLGVTSPKPDMTDCDLDWRVGNLMPQGEDHWWHVIPATDIAKLSDEIASVITSICVPKVNEHISDDGMIKVLLSRETLLMSEYARYSDLTSLLKIYDRPELVKIANEFWTTFKDNAFFEEDLEKHLKRIGVKPFESFFE